MDTVISSGVSKKMLTYEDRKLSFQLVPQSSWYSNLRSILPNWKEISDKVRSIGRCEICGEEYDPKDLEAHEVWEFNDETHQQLLKRIDCTCFKCHTAIHIGLAGVKGKEKVALYHYKKVNNLSDIEVREDEEMAFEVWGMRSMFDWTIDEQQIINRVNEQLQINSDFKKAINNRFYTKVSYNEKDEAKSMGAKWDPDRKMWYFLSEEKRNMWDESRNKKEP